MKLKQLRGKKSLKLLFLLLTSLLIGTVSAVSYSYLYMNGTITVGTQQLVWIKNGATISGSTVTMSFSVQPAIPQWFNQSLYLKNVDTSASHNVTIGITTALTPSGGFTYAKMYAYDANATGAPLDIFNLSITSKYMFINPLLSNHAYLLDFGINATATAVGSYTFSIQAVYQ
jgi:hypothetical protein